MERSQLTDLSQASIAKQLQLSKQLEELKEQHNTLLAERSQQETSAGDSAKLRQELDETTKKLAALQESQHKSVSELEHRLTAQELEFGNNLRKLKAKVKQLKTQKAMLIAEIKRLSGGTGALPGLGGSPSSPKIGRAVQQECRDRSRMPSSA
eukprot:TRINITY_DN45288_c0_g1_i5.p1 TRINITY_DN45288_c0_g1~~TRINITY_DN45288_c0_g1_i5.p1  ORF type:complete len:163 (-),score=41.98 TRINITY_DN45288_c0_g1_i5:10-468(-)